jgi:hypothetical protein
MKLRRLSKGHYVTECGRYYVMATERCGANGRAALKGRWWWNAGRCTENGNEADDPTYERKREAVARLAVIMETDKVSGRSL